MEVKGQGGPRSRNPSSASVGASAGSGSRSALAKMSESESHDPFSEFEEFFQKFWAELAGFGFDKAKEIAEREKERALKTHVQTNQGSSSGFTWVILTTAMSQISGTEKAYVTLIFLAPKGFLRKDSNLKSTLESIRFDLKKIAESSVTASPARHKNCKVASSLLILVNLRLDMMEFYEKLSVYGTAKNVEISDLMTDVEMIYEKFCDEKKSCRESSIILKGILNSLNWELQVIINLLKSSSAMQIWEYLESTIALQEANNALQEWNEFVLSQSLSLKKSPFYAAAPSYPALFLWVKKLKAALVSKFTLYFYELLAQHSNPSYDIKTYTTKLSVDYYSRLASFQKKSDAHSVSIIFDARDTNFHHKGYRFPGRPEVYLQGLDSFPAILSIPTKPTNHWPSIVMLINDKMVELSDDRVIAIYDARVQVTYFVQRIDARMYLVIVFENKKSEKDSYTLKFLNEIAIEIKCGKIYSALKSFKP